MPETVEFRDLMRPSMARLLSFGVPYGDVDEALEFAEGELGWAAALDAKGEHYERAGEEAFLDGRGTTAVEHWLRAAACYHYAQFKLACDPAYKLVLQRRCRAVYRRAAPLLEPEGRPVSIAVPGLPHTPGYLRVPADGAPCVILVNGLDSAKEVELHHFAEVFSRRGLATLVVDGPGQGELGGAASLAGFAAAVPRWVDFLATSPCGVGAPVGVFGVSFGGHLAALAAATDPRIAACVSLGGFFDGSILDKLPPPARRALCRAYDVPDGTPLELITGGISLEPLRGRMDAPLFVIHGSEDHLVDRRQVEAMRAWAGGGARLWVVEGAEHVCADHFGHVLPVMGDWMRAMLTRPAHAAPTPQRAVECASA